MFGNAEALCMTGKGWAPLQAWDGAGEYRERINSTCVSESSCGAYICCNKSVDENRLKAIIVLTTSHFPFTSCCRRVVESKFYCTAACTL